MNFGLFFLTLTICIFTAYFSFVIYSSKSSKLSYYKGPTSEYFDGKQFKRDFQRPANIQIDDNNKSFSFAAMLKRIFLNEYEGKWEQYTNKDLLKVNYTKPQERNNTNEIHAYIVNHSTVLIQVNGLNIITDPVYSNTAGIMGLGVKRAHPPSIAFEDLPKIDLVLVSHSHYDHLDINTIKKLYKRDNPIFVVPAGVDYIIRKVAKKADISYLLWGESVKPFNNIDLVVNLEKVYHWSKRTLHDTNKALWGSFVIETANKKIYFAGDTAFGDGAVFSNIKDKYQKIDFAMIPIGAYEPRGFMKYSHNNPHEAVKIHNLINSKYSIGIHWGTFQLSSESYFQPEVDLKESAQFIEDKSSQFLSPYAGEITVIR